MEKSRLVPCVLLCHCGTQRKEGSPFGVDLVRRNPGLIWPKTLSKMGQVNSTVNLSISASLGRVSLGQLPSSTC